MLLPVVVEPFVAQSFKTEMTALVVLIKLPRRALLHKYRICRTVV